MATHGSATWSEAEGSCPEGGAVSRYSMVDYHSAENVELNSRVVILIVLWTTEPMIYGSHVACKRMIQQTARFSHA